MEFVTKDQQMTDAQSYTLAQLSRHTESEDLVSQLRARYVDKMQASELIGLLKDEKYDLANVKINWILEDYKYDKIDVNVYETMYKEE